jgi:hypothetical protein
LENHENLSLNITGNCTPIPEPTENMEFSAEIRQSENKEIKIFNDSDRIWYLKPIIFGECFTTTSKFSIEPKIEQHCTIIYKPKKVTINNSFDMV